MLEFCDWGCLRDALDAGAFFSGGSLNYAAILDTAADVAKAMLHLHCNQVGKGWRVCGSAGSSPHCNACAALSAFELCGQLRDGRSAAVKRFAA